MASQMGQRSHSYSAYSTGAPALQVSTNTSSEHDPNERTARPGNAHQHAAFHNSLALPLPPMPDSGNSLVTPTATTSGSSGLSSMSSAGLSSAGNVSSASSAHSSFADAQQQHLQRHQEQDITDRAAQDYIAGTPGLSKGLSRPLSQIEKERLAWLDRLKYFLATAPSRWHTTDTELTANITMSGPASTAFAQGVNIYPGMGIDGSYTSHPAQHAPSHPQLNRFMLPSQEFVTCVLWNGLYHITGTDIVRALVFRFEAFGRPVRNMKKFEEGVFSDLRNLKPGVDACLEEPKSSFLDLLFKYQCIRTQKKQKVFYWFSVPHDRLFLDALDRDLKREKMGQEPTTAIVGEPAMSFTYDSKRPLYEQFSKALGARDGESEFDRNVRNAVKDSSNPDDEDSGLEGGSMTEESSDSHSDMEDVMGTDDDGRPRTSGGSVADAVGKQLFGYPLLGPSGYKQRRKKASSQKLLRQDSEDPSEERGRTNEAGSSGRFGSVSHSRERSRLVPRYESIRHEFGPGSEDEQRQGEASLSAADYFLKQAKGELLPADGVIRKPRVSQPIGEVNVYYSEGAPPAPPPTAATGPSTHVFELGQSTMARPGHLRGRSTDQITPSTHPHRHSYHGGNLSSSFGTNDFFSAQNVFNQVPVSSAGLTASTSGTLPPQQQPRPAPPPPAPVSSTAMYEQHGADGKIKAFVCPLFSCGRLFKRMEHLKRHLRTHTMERPFTCPKCKKRFSRSDNLNQHLRTHDRTGSGPGGAPGSGAPGDGSAENSGSDNANGEWNENMDDDRDASSGHGGDHSGGESEDEDWARYTASLGDMNYQALGLTGVDLSALGMAGTYAPDVQMRELEASDVQEVQGDEEGLLMVANPGSGYYPVQSALFSSGDFNADPSQWNRPQASPAFSTISMPSPNPGHISLRSNRNSITSSPANYLQQLQGHSAGSSISSSYGDDFAAAAAMSAPSHKANFDHGNLYAPSMVLDDAGIGAGPIRRHRSMTPSHARNGEPIRRPGTANSGEFNPMGGTPASVGSSSSASSHRGYHPYASGYASSSRSGSAHSSPSLHNIPLASASEFGAHVRSSSRSSNYAPPGVMQVQEQMKHMMSMGAPDVAMGGADAGNAFSDAVFRTDSPAFVQQGVTESPAPYSIDLPGQFGAQGQGFGAPQHSASMPQFGQQQQQQFGDGYYPSHLPTL